MTTALLQVHDLGHAYAGRTVLAGQLGQVPAWRGWTRQFTRADRQLALHSLDRVALLDHAEQRANTLSGGQQQRVVIARALARQAALIVADEPVASLDPAISAGILEPLQRICAEDGVAVVCSLHQPHLAQRYAQRRVGLAQCQAHFEAQARSVDSAATAALYQSAAAAA